MHSYQILLTVVLVIETITFSVNIIRYIRYKNTVLHYNIAAFFMIIGQACLFFLQDWNRMDHTFVYLNECQLTTHDDAREKCSPFHTIRDPIRGMDQGIVAVHDLSIYQSLVILLIYTFTIGHCLYAANRSEYDHSIKWIEYVFSSSLQTMLLYSLFGQVAQVIWVVVGLKMFAMMTAYGIEVIMVHKKENGILAKFVTNRADLFLILSFFMYGFFHYGPLFVRNYSKEKNINGQIETLESTDKPVWAYFFFASIIICEGLFPYLIYKHRENINCVNADIDFCLLSMVSKITFNSALIIALIKKDVHRTWGVGAAIGAIWISGGIIYYFVKRSENNTTKIYKRGYESVKR